MTLENRVRVFAGFMILIAVALTLFVSQYWLILVAFVGVNLIQSAFTRFCPAEIALKKIFHESPNKSESITA